MFLNIARARVSPDLALTQPWTGPALKYKGQGQQNCLRAGPWTVYAGMELEFTGYLIQGAPLGPYLIIK